MNQNARALRECAVTRLPSDASREPGRKPGALPLRNRVTLASALCAAATRRAGHLPALQHRSCPPGAATEMTPALGSPLPRVGHPLPPPAPRGSRASSCPLLPSHRHAGQRRTAARAAPPSQGAFDDSAIKLHAQRLICIMKCWLIYNGIMETEERNWNGIRRTWSRK